MAPVAAPSTQISAQPQQVAVAAAAWRPARPPQIVRARRPTHEDLMAADRQLRRAYARAVSAGVPRPILVNYRNRWEDLRQEASWRPARVAIGYAAMASDLTRMSQPQRGYSRPRRSRHAYTW